MNERDVDGNGSVDAERLRRLRLSEFLRDLVRQEGKMEAAELLGVNHKTLTRAEESGEITGRMGDALELLLRRADDAEVARLREAVGALEERVAALEGGMETPPAADVEGGGESSQVEGGDEDGTQAQAQGGKHEEGAGPVGDQARPSDGGCALEGSGRRCAGWTRRWSPRSPPTTMMRSTAMRGRWWRSGDGCGPGIPTRGRACRGSRRRSVCSCWSWLCWRSTG